VRDWVASQRALGNWDLLRKARKGLEKGVKRPISARDIELWDTITRLREHGRSLEAVHRLLAKRGTIPPMSRQGFNKLVARLDAMGVLPYKVTMRKPSKKS
jgi:DNA-binding transcriptional MerR regulator